MTEAESMIAQEAELVFRLMKLTDIQDILIIEREAFTISWTEEAFRNELTHNHFAKYMV
ncbi:MAG TPA: ribosomal-protein-alanine N-acetyltransferase RimI, partial [Paenibacillus sp.]|nr:ribosomal-protein-alanine N-acetyltransferase RimI [Paenibacillus sp.]